MHWSRVIFSSLLFLSPLPLRALDLPAPERLVRFLDGQGPSLFEKSAAEAWFSRYLPAGFSESPVQVAVDDGNSVWDSRQPRISAEFMVRRRVVVGARATVLTNEQGQPVFEDRPVFLPENLLGFPNQPFLSPEQIRERMREMANDREVRYGETVYASELRRFLCVINLLPDIDNFARRHTTLILLDAITGEVVETERFCLEAGPERVWGKISGHALAADGPEVACFLDTSNPALRRDLAGFPVTLRQTESRQEFSATTDDQGGFRFDGVPAGPWTLRVELATPCQTLRTARRADPLLLAEVAGNGSAELTVDLNSDPGETREGEFQIGHIAAWEFHQAARRYLDEIRDRIRVYPRLRGCPEQIYRGVTGDYQMQLYHVPIDEDTLFAGAFYSDIGAGGGGAVIAVNGPNRYYRGWSNGAVVLHESGHWLVLALTGRPQEGGYPIGHHGASHEFVADMFLLLYAARHNQNGIGDGRVGCHRDRGYPESFHRDVRLGRSCFPDQEHPQGPCLLETGFELWPSRPGDTAHDASLAYSGFFWDVLVACVQRYGQAAGVSQAEDLFFRYIDYHAGGILKPFNLPTSRIWLMLDDHPDNGGNNNPFDGSPNGDIITHALARHGLWLEPFSRGDVNGDGRLELSDAVASLNFLFRSGQTPSCLDAADADDNGRVELTDAVFTLKHLFGGGPTPPDPVHCATDPTFEDRVTCAAADAACAVQ